MSSTIEASPVPGTELEAVLPLSPAPGGPPPLPHRLRDAARAAMSGHVYHFLVIAALGLAATIYFAPAVHEDVEVLRLVFLLVAALLLVLSLFRVSDDLRVSTLLIAPPAMVNLFLCFLFGFVLSRGEAPETTLVYILGFAALIIGGQHLVEFHGTEETIERLNAQLAATGGQLMEQLASSETRLGELNKGFQQRLETQMITLRYDKYRDQITKAYASAEQRVLGSASHWPMDPHFWDPLKKDLTLEDEAFWDNQDVYRNLLAALQRSRASGDGPRLRIVFAGGLDVVPAPETSPALSESDFMLFVGVLWRLALARRLRKATEAPADSYQHPARADVRVVVADIPINAHVIDGDVFLLRRKPGDAHESSMGIKIADGNNAQNPTRESDLETADTFAEIIQRYTRRTVRSAREYAASLLVFAALARGEPRDVELVDAHGVPDLDTIRELLQTLGLDAWARASSGIIGNAVHVDAAQLCKRTTELTAYFLQHYYADRKLVKLPSRAHYWDQPDNAGSVTVDRLIEDMI